MQTGLVFNIQKFSIHDGPGIRTTVFLKGCPLCCSWCHNPEGISPRSETIVVETRCIHCGTCHDHDESEAVEVCPTGARQHVGREMSVAEVMKEILADKVFYDESGGGATFSGGEPLAQPAFVLALLEECRGEGIRTALDTCGFGRTEDLLATARLAEVVLYDLKLMDEARHRQHCGVPNATILGNLRALANVHRRIWIRVPVIPGVNDDAENVSAIAQFAATLPCVEQVNLLPYHKTGLSKHRRVGYRYAHTDLQPPSAEQMATAARYFRDCGLNVTT
jgi:pyruvate formate lyase activating enzyme